MRHPLVNVITHPANRSPGARAGYDLDFDRLFEVAVETGTAMEVDGAPGHLDMDGAVARRAAEPGRHDGHRQRLPPGRQRWAGRWSSGSGPRAAAGSSRATCSTRESAAEVRAFVAAQARPPLSRLSRPRANVRSCLRGSRMHADETPCAAVRRRASLAGQPVAWAAAQAQAPRARTPTRWPARCSSATRPSRTSPPTSSTPTAAACCARRRSERGTVKIKKPGKMRWVYTAPETEGVRLGRREDLLAHPAGPAGDGVAGARPTATPPRRRSSCSGKGDIARDFTAAIVESPVAGAVGLKLTPEKPEAAVRLLRGRHRRSRASRSGRSPPATARAATPSSPS